MNSEFGDLRHARVKEIRQQDDGSVLIDTKSYHDGPHMSAHEVEIMEHIKTDGRKYLADVMNSLSVLKERRVSHVLIELRIDKSYQPRMITRTYTASKSEFKKT